MISRPSATAPAISYTIFLLLLILTAYLHLATVLITGLFGYLALQTLSAGRYRWAAVAVFLVLLAVLFYGFAFFVRQASVELPEIVSTSVPKIVKYATSRGIELPFTDFDSLKSLAFDTAIKTSGYLGSFARIATKEFLFLVVGVIVAISLFLSPKVDRASLPAPQNLYALHAQRMTDLFGSLFASFRRVMGAQVIISAINTVLTGAFVYAAGLPYATVVTILTFLCGLLPVVGNLLSNTLIVALGFTVSPHFAGWALLFLVVIHKLEYFLNSRIIGGRIRHPMWLTLLALLVGERLMGIAGIILAPVFLNFIRNEASRYQLPDSVSRQD
ncbi:membrane protein [soil metagenome]